MPGLNRRSTSKGRKSLLGALQDAPIRTARQKNRASYIATETDDGPINTGSKNLESAIEPSSDRIHAGSQTYNSVNRTPDIYDFICGGMEKESKATNTEKWTAGQELGLPSHNTQGSAHENRVVLHNITNGHDHNISYSLKEKNSKMARPPEMSTSKLSDLGDPKANQDNAQPVVLRRKREQHTEPGLRNQAQGSARNSFDADVFSMKTQIDDEPRVSVKGMTDALSTVDEVENIREKTKRVTIENPPDTKLEGKDTLRALKQRKKMLKRLLRYQHAQNTEATEEVKLCVVETVNSVKQKGQELVDRMQEEYERTAITILDHVDQLEAQIQILKTERASKRHTFTKDSSFPNSSTDTEEDQNVTANRIQTDRNATDQISLEVMSAEIDKKLCKIQKFIKSSVELDFGKVVYEAVPAELLKSSKSKRKRPQAHGSSVSSDPRRSILLDSPLEKICDKRTCKLRWMQDRESKYKGPLLNVEDMTFTVSGDLIVAEQTVSSGRLQVFGPSGESKGTIQEGLIFPWSVAVHDGKIITANRNTKTLEITSFDGKENHQWPKDMFVYPQSIAVDHTGQFYVVDTEERELSVFKLNEKGIVHVRTIGGDSDELGIPVSVAVSKDLFVAVLDKANHCVHMFDDTGNFLYSFGKSGSGDGSLKHPSAITMDTKGNIYIADSHNNRVSKFSVHGLFLEHVVTEDDGILDPTVVAVGNTGLLAVGDMHGIKVFNIDNKPSS